MPVFWYENKDTIIHRMNPVLKFWMYIIFVYMGTCYTIVEFRIPLFIIMTTFAYFAKMPKWWWRYPYLMLFLAIPWDMLTGTFAADPALYARLPLWITEIDIYTIKDVVIGPMHFGAIGLTGPNLYFYLSTAIFRVSSWAMLLSLVYTISPTQQLQMLATAKAPAPLQFLFMLPWRYSSVMAQKINRVYQAQTLRGFRRKKSRNPFVEAKRMFPLMMPLVRDSVIMIDEISVAAEARAFGTGPRGPLYEFKMSKLGWVIIIPLLIILVVTQYFYWTVKWGTI